MSDIMDHVYRGAALLDARGPHNWRAMIDVEKLEQNDVSKCVLGQVYGASSSSRSGYDRGKRELGLDIADSGYHGFTASHTAYDNSQFTTAWKRYLKSMPPAPVAVEQPEVVMTRELARRMVKRFKQIDDPNHTLEETVFVVDGVRIVLS